MGFDPQSLRKLIEQKHTAILQRRARELPAEAVGLARELYRDGVAIRTIHEGLKEQGLVISTHKLSKLIRARRARRTGGNGGNGHPALSGSLPSNPNHPQTSAAAEVPGRDSRTLMDELSKAVVTERTQRGPQF